MKLPHRAFAALLMLIAISASADVIYGDLTPDFGNSAVMSDLDPNPFGAVELAVGFSLSAEAHIVTDIHWWGLYISELGDFLADDDFVVRIFGDNGSGAPETSAAWLDLAAGAVTRSDTGIPFSPSTNIFEYSLDISPLNLIAGDTYYLSVVNNTAGDLDQWFWMAGGPNPWFFRTGDDTTWIDNSGAIGQPLFALTGVVPEPASLTLVIFGAGVLGLARGRTRRR